MGNRTLREWVAFKIVRKACLCHTLLDNAIKIQGFLSMGLYDEIKTQHEDESNKYHHNMVHLGMRDLLANYRQKIGDALTWFFEHVFGIPPLTLLVFDYV